MYVVSNDVVTQHDWLHESRSKFYDHLITYNHGALVVTQAMLLRPINCSFIIYDDYYYFCLPSVL